MKRLYTTLILFFMVGTFLCGNAWGDLYKFSFNASDLMTTTLFSYDFTTSTPYPIGARKMTKMEYDSSTGSYNVVGEYYSEWSDSNFINEVLFGDWYLEDFNLWGLGGTEAEGWNETETYQALLPNAVSTGVAWDYSYVTISPYTDPVLKFTVDSSQYYDGIPFSGSSYDVTFSFIADVSDATLNIWFGGTLNNAKTVVDPTHPYIKYQGNLQLTGTPVPEPSTILMISMGLMAALPFLSRKRG